jgi:tol-pal system protein YbgF
MTLCHSRLSTGFALLVLACVLPVNQAAAESTTERLDRLERQLDSRGLIDMLNRLDQLQRDLQELRGELEVQTHRQEDMTRRQRELYLDIDRRLQQLESGQPEAPVATFSPPGSPETVVPATVEPTQAPTRATDIALDTGAPAANHAGEQAAYEQALGILREGRYTDAAAAFDRQLASYPGGEYADNATYWLGETYYVTRDFDRALSTFKRLVNDFPQSPKMPDARLKIGYIHYENSGWAQARQELSAVVDDYPGTTAARLANDRLQRMQQEGH